MWTVVKRFLLFGLVNMLILVSLSFALNLICAFLGISPNGYYNYLLLISVVMGFGGAFMSLLLSKWTAKTFMGVQVIPLNTNDPALRHVIESVHTFAKAARLPKMPEVGFYNSPEVNAFATGPSKSNSLVAVSAGLLQRMNRDEIEGVLGHEVTHIANGDMVTMTLLQGVINAVVIFAARAIAQVITSQGRSENRSPFLYMGIVFGLEILFSILGMIAVNYFSRAREFRADSGGARYAGRDKMIASLRALQGTLGRLNKEQQALATLKISGRPHGALMTLFATHPSLEDRIRRLETGR